MGMTREERNDAIEFFKKVAEKECNDAKYSKLAIEALEQKPSNDMVSCGVFEQAVWERDVAIEQLKELGYELGEKIETDKDTISRQAYIERYRKWGYSEFGRKMGNDALAIRVAMSLPSVTLQPKTGYWIEYDHGLGVKCYQCSNCKGCDRGEKGKYCKWCRAEMVEKQERK